MFFKIKQQLFANEPKGAPQQVVWGTFLRVCLSPRNSNIHLVCEAGFSNPVHIWYYGKTKVKE